VRLRREIASQMSDAEIVAAQRAARDWLLAIGWSTDRPSQLNVGFTPAGFLDRAILMDTRLSDPELIHTAKCIRRFDLVTMPAVEVERRRRMWIARGEPLERRPI
jgi:hypothetical protein